MAWMKRQDNSGGAQSDYLNSADTATRPMALASILFTLVLIAALAVLLFSAGKWAYNRINQDDATVATTSEQVSNDSTAQSTTSEPAENTTPSTATTTDQPIGEPQGVSSSQSAENQPNNTASTATTPATGAVSTPNTVPNTGTGALLSVFMTTFILATGAAYGRHIVRKNQ